VGGADWRSWVVRTGVHFWLCEWQAKKKVEGQERKVESLKKKKASLQLRLEKKKIAITDKEENKTIALSTSKLNYLDPRISFQWVGYSPSTPPPPPLIECWSAFQRTECSSERGCTGF
jgi:hypothetical protein